MLTKNQIDLIIFDCDGVLVDSERIANLAFAKLLQQRFNLQFTLPQMYETFMGKSAHQCMRIVENLLGRKASTDLIEQYNDHIKCALEKSLIAIDGVDKMLREIDLPYCVASSGSIEKIHFTLSKTQLIDYFNDKLFSTSMVGRGKPHPDIYLYAARHMGDIDVKKYLVVEDSLFGIQGARQAGMIVFGYTGQLSKTKLINAGAHHTLDNMANLAKEIAKYTH